MSTATTVICRSSALLLADRAKVFTRGSDQRRRSNLARVRGKGLEGRNRARPATGHLLPAVWANEISSGTLSAMPRSDHVAVVKSR